MSKLPIFLLNLMLLHALGVAVLGQQSGRINGTVRVASGAPAPNITVIVTNQVSGKWKRARSNTDGTYAFRLDAGAYRLRVAPPNVAKFDKDKNYGEFAIPRGEALENVIVEAGKDTVIDIPLDQVELKEIPNQAAESSLVSRSNLPPVKLSSSASNYSTAIPLLSRVIGRSKSRQPSVFPTTSMLARMAL